MAGFTTSETHPNWEDVPRSERRAGTSSIEGTRGLWVRKNLKEDSLEIWIDGELFAEWAKADLIESRITTLLRVVFEHGQHVGARANQKSLRAALGLDDPGVQ